MKIEDYPKEQLLELYRQMLTVREFELRAIAERRAGLIPGFIHSCVGQEATAVGACAALRPDDVITSTHRGHGHLVAKGGLPKPIFDSWIVLYQSNRHKVSSVTPVELAF